MCSIVINSVAFTRAITFSSLLSDHTRMTWENVVFIITFQDNADVQANNAYQTFLKVLNHHISEQHFGPIEI